MITLSLGGSVINPGTIDTKFLEDFSQLIRKFSLSQKFVICCGGGSISRQYIKALPPGLSEGEKDVMGIMPTWLNAKLVYFFLRDLASSILPKSVEELEDQLKRHPVAFCGGFLPSLKTDEDAAICADYLKAESLINVTNVLGVFDKDPKIFRDAKMYDRLTYEEFYKIIGSASLEAGSRAPFTLIAMKILERTRIPVYIVPNDINLIQKAIEGETVGTVIF